MRSVTLLVTLLLGTLLFLNSQPVNAGEPVMEFVEPTYSENIETPASTPESNIPVDTPIPSQDAPVMIKRAAEERSLAETEQTILKPSPPLADPKKPSPCKAPPFPKNGFHVNTTNTVAFYCDPGFKRVGPKVVKCMKDGLYDSSFPKCIGRLCKKPPKVAHSSFTYSNGRRYPSDTTYKCDQGYYAPAGSNMKIACNRRGRWPVAPVCKPIVCNEPPKLDNGMVVFSSKNFDSVAQYSCSAGFKLSGPAQVFCGAKGEFAVRGATTGAQKPTCQPIKCKVPAKNIRSAKKIFASNKGFYPSNLEIRCYKGFKVKKTARTSECQANGEYTNLPSCQPHKCITALKVKNARVKFSDKKMKVGSLATIKCKKGFKHVGAKNATCIATTKYEFSAAAWGFNGQTTLCKPIKCKKFPDIDNMATVHISNKRNFPSAAVVDCKPGFEAVKPVIGAPTRCTIKGNWKNVPKCKRTECFKSPYDHGVAAREDNTVEFKCKDNYELMVGVWPRCVARPLKKL